MTDSATIAAADHLMRNWESPEPGGVRIGSEVHKQLFCRMLLDTHNPYRPAKLDWPKLDDVARARLLSLPIWDIAVQTEGRASIRVKTFAARITDSILRPALELDAAEEARHKDVLSHLVAAYGIKLQPEPNYPPPDDAEWAWLVTGFSECIDSFFAFGLFEIARTSGYFPLELVDTFEPIIQEETRHIIFFANWVAWYRTNMPLRRRPWFLLKVLGVWAFLIYERIGIARGFDDSGNAQDANFAMTGAGSVGVDLAPLDLMALCLKENDRRMAGYDKRLLRPATVPALVRLALKVMQYKSKT
ncbi:MAG TPA: ferritin-like domain-containing protein [Magnetospirillaceae bacterium]|jgi:hypothetical protein